MSHPHPLICRAHSDLLFYIQKTRMPACMPLHPYPHSMNDPGLAISECINEGHYPWLCVDGEIIKSKLNMVDLAGSERTRKTGTSGSIAKEATYINKSLSCLSMVHPLLSTPSIHLPPQVAKELRKKTSHVHYRDSKLTHYLKVNYCLLVNRNLTVYRILWAAIAVLWWSHVSGGTPIISTKVYQPAALQMTYNKSETDPLLHH